MTLAEFEEIKGMLQKIDNRLDAIEAAMSQPVKLDLAHTVTPHPDTDMYPVFDHDGREVDYEAASLGGAAPSSWPLEGTCQCGQRIMQIAPGIPWGHYS